MKRPRAAAALGWGVLFFLSLQLALAVAMERWRPELRDLEYGSKRTRLRARLAEKPGHPLLLVLGSSRINHGFRPEALPPLGPSDPVVFNASLMGSGPVMELMCLRRLLADGVHPDWVVLECWPPFWNQEGDRAEVNRIATTRLGWSDLRVLSRCGASRQLLYQQWLLARLTPWSSSRFVLLTQFARDWLPREPRRDDLWLNIDPDGWLPYTGSTGARDAEQRTALSHAGYGPLLQEFRLSPVADRALREMLNLCRQKRIRVALLFMPEAKAFQSWYPPAVRAEVDRYLARLSGDCAVPVIDARDWSDDADFADGFHLFPRGASAFTEKFGRDVLPKLLTDKGR